MLRMLKQVTCQGKPVSSLYGCISHGVLCSDAGDCLNGVCKCNEGKAGEFCQHDANSSSLQALLLGAYH